MTTILGSSFFRLKHFQRVHNSRSSFAWHDDVIYISSFRSFQWVREFLLVVQSLLLRVLTSEDNFYSTFGSHDSDLSWGPSVVEITFEVLWWHHIVSTTISLPCDKSDFRHCCFGVGIKQFRTMFDDTIPFLRRTRQEARNITKSHNRDLESIAESDESCCLHRCVDVKAACKYLRLVGNHPDRLAFDFDKTSQDIFSVWRHNLVKLISISHCFNRDLHVIRFIWIVRNNVIQHFGWSLVQAVCSGPRFCCSLYICVLRQIAQ